MRRRTSASFCLRFSRTGSSGDETLKVGALVSTAVAASAGRASGSAAICNACCFRPPPRVFFKSRLAPPFFPFALLPFNEASNSTSSSVFSVPERCSTAIGFVSPLSAS
jgi:hypothetical protein